MEEPILILIGNLTNEYRERWRYLVLSSLMFSPIFFASCWNWRKIPLTASKLSPTTPMSSTNYPCCVNINYNSRFTIKYYFRSFNINNNFFYYLRVHLVPFKDIVKFLKVDKDFIIYPE